MNAPDIRTRTLLLAVVCASVFSMPRGAVAQPFPLFCHGPLHTNAAAVPLPSTPFTWSLNGAGTVPPGAEECAWADRGPRGTEIQSGPPPANVICGALFHLASLPAGEYSEICVTRDSSAPPPETNCMRVDEGRLGGLRQPPFPKEPVCTLPQSPR
jgi:hypothetical protein